MTLPVLCLGGIGESGVHDMSASVSGMLANVTRKLDPEFFEPIWVPWVAEYGPDPKWDGLDYNTAVHIGEQQLIAAIEQHVPDKCLLLGYSGGAHVAGNVATYNPKVAGCALIADPMKPVTGYPGGYGILGQRWVRPCWFWEVANPADIICACPAASPLRTIADVTRGFSVTEPLQWGMTLKDTVWQQWWHEPSADWGSVAIGLDGYLSPYPWGMHTGYDHLKQAGTQLTYCDWLAQEINQLDRNKWSEKPPTA